MLHTFLPSLKQTASDLLAFIKNPTDKPVAAISTLGKLRVLFMVLLMDILIAPLLVGLLEVVKLLGWFNSNNHAVVEMMRSLPMWGFLLLGVVVVPLMEEVVFRFGLRFRRGFFVVLFTIVLLVLAGFGFKLLPLLWALGVMVALGVVLVLYFINAYAIGNYLEQVWPRKYRYVFYTVAFLFGLIHITNFTDFDYASAGVLLIPIIVAPQIWAGLAMGYMRVKYGFFWGFYLHAAHNAFFFILALAFMSNLDERLSISNEHYTLKVEEHMRPEPTATSRSYIGNDSISFENKELIEVVTLLLEKERTLVQHNRKDKHLKKVINLSYKSNTSDSAQNKRLILAQLQELYKLEVNISEWEQEVWDLEVEDNGRLARYAVDKAGLLRTTVTPEQISLENVTLKELLKTVNSEFYVILNDKTTQDGKYNFRFDNKGFDQFREDLKQKYGLTLHPKKIMAEHAIVESRK